MNYLIHYTNLVERAKHRTLDSYTELHHIIPKCMGGLDNVDNLVSLTPEEHYVAHQLLVKIYPKERKLLFAARMMSVNLLEKRNNKQFGWIKRRISEMGHSSETKSKMSISHLGERNHFYGKTHTIETKENQSRVMKGRMVGDKNPFFGKKHSPELQKQINEKNTGRKHIDEAKKKIGEASASRIRKPISEETKRKISETLKSRKLDK